jgi:hypothetical protein
MFCANCGIKLEEGVQFCSNCGGAVKSAEFQVSALQESLVQENVEQLEYKEQNLPYIDTQQPAQCLNENNIKRPVSILVMSIIVVLLYPLTTMFTIFASFPNISHDASYTPRISTEAWFIVFLLMPIASIVVAIVFGILGIIGWAVRRLYNLIYIGAIVILAFEVFRLVLGFFHPAPIFIIFVLLFSFPISICFVVFAIKYKRKNLTSRARRC